MASNSYYGAGGQQQINYDQGQNASYGASYGQQQQQPSYEQGGYGASQQQGAGQTYSDQVYPDGSREQQYDASGNPVLPNGERGLLGDLAGAGAGAFLGHKVGHGFLGSIAGGLGAHLLGDAFKKQNHGGGGGLFGRRDIDGAPDGSPDQGYGQQPYSGEQAQYSQNPAYGESPYAQNQTYGGEPAYNQNQNYGQNYGQN